MRLHYRNASRKELDLGRGSRKRKTREASAFQAWMGERKRSGVEEGVSSMRLSRKSSSPRWDRKERSRGK